MRIIMDKVPLIIWKLSILHFASCIHDALSADPFMCKNDVCNRDGNYQFCSEEYGRCSDCKDIVDECGNYTQPINCTRFCTDFLVDMKVKALRDAGVSWNRLFYVTVSILLVETLVFVTVCFCLCKKNMNKTLRNETVPKGDPTERHSSYSVNVDVNDETLQKLIDVDDQTLSTTGNHSFVVDIKKVVVQIPPRPRFTNGTQIVPSYPAPVDNQAEQLDDTFSAAEVPNGPGLKLSIKSNVLIASLDTSETEDDGSEKSSESVTIDLRKMKTEGFKLAVYDLPKMETLIEETDETVRTTKFDDVSEETNICKKKESTYEDKTGSSIADGISSKRNPESIAFTTNLQSASDETLHVIQQDKEHDTGKVKKSARVTICPCPKEVTDQSVTNLESKTLCKDHPDSEPFLELSGQMRMICRERLIEPYSPKLQSDLKLGKHTPQRSDSFTTKAYADENTETTSQRSQKIRTTAKNIVEMTVIEKGTDLAFEEAPVSIEQKQGNEPSESNRNDIEPHSSTKQTGFKLAVDDIPKITELKGANDETLHVIKHDEEHASLNVNTDTDKVKESARLTNCPRPKCVTDQSFTYLERNTLYKEYPDSAPFQELPRQTQIIYEKRLIEPYIPKFLSVLQLGKHTPQSFVSCTTVEDADENTATASHRNFQQTNVETCPDMVEMTMIKEGKEDNTLPITEKEIKGIDVISRKKYEGDDLFHEHTKIETNALLADEIIDVSNVCAFWNTCRACWILKLQDASMPLDEHKEDMCINKDDLNTLCKLHGRKSNKVSVLCDRMSKALQECDRTIFKRVWAAYRHKFENDIVFVIECTNIYDAKGVILPSPLTTLDIEYIDVNASSQEDTEITFSEARINKQLTLNELNNLNDNFFERSEELLDKHKHLSIIKACSVKSKNYGKNSQTILKETCVVFYVHVKGLIPIKEDPFPDTFNTLPTDVREGIFQLYGPTAKSYHPRIRMGSQISGEWPKSGTLGPIVDLPNNRAGLIVSAHVVLSEYWHCLLRKNGTLQRINLLAYQPQVSSTNIPFGRISQGAYRPGGNGVAGLEVVLIEIEDTGRTPDTGLFPDGDFRTAGFDAQDPMKFISGKICPDPNEVRRMTLIKYGSETDITNGQFDLSGPLVCRNMVFDKDISVRLYNQIQVTGQAHRPFAVPGDSSALVFAAYEGNQNDLRAVGILTGGKSDGCVCFVTPIKDVLDVFGYNLSLKRFNYQQPNGTPNQHIPMDET